MHQDENAQPPFNINDIHGEFGSYAEEYRRSIDDPEGYWRDAAKELDWFEEPQTILQQRYENNPNFFDWFPDGKLNTSYLCLDVHVKNGKGDEIALIYDSPLSGGIKQKISFGQLLDQVRPGWRRRREIHRPATFLFFFLVPISFWPHSL